ncbi:MAG TPA: acyl-CoA dehydrogenase family protein [Acidimicrobiales bacterium]|jgi:butyryl-CoA dehydrogenase|nr:acyl-CoA dehydrogenase family protein [Acidimicrobiales bacterium]
MSLEFTEEQDALRNVVRDFAAAEMAPHAEQWDRDHFFPVDTVRAMGELGLFGLPFPEEYGGGGADLTTLCIAIEELGRVDQSMAITLEAGVGLGANPIFRFGSEAQRQEWLPDLCAGRAIGGFGLTEPEAGSDAGGTRTRAVFDAAAGEWVVNGEKAFITNSGTAMTSLVTVTARTDPPDNPSSKPEISAIIVPAGAAGFTVAPPYRKMGWHASDTHGLHFDDCRVPEANLLGDRGRGFAQFLAILDEGRVAIAALAVGVIQCCLDESVAYAKQRNAFGQPIGRNQAVAFKCADLQVMVDAARHLTYHAARLRDQGKPYKREAAVAKLYATEAAVTATREATQVFGGYGFMDETLVARQYRDAKILEIGEGTSEVQRLVISRDLGLPVA